MSDDDMVETLDFDVLMSRKEGDLYESLAMVWFLNKQYKILDYKRARGVDYYIETPDGERYWYEVKGTQLIIIRRGKRSKKGSLSVAQISLGNIEREKIEYYLVFVFDNFANDVKVFRLTKQRMREITRDNPRTLRLYDLFNNFGLTKVFYDIKEIDLTKLSYRV